MKLYIDKNLNLSPDKVKLAGEFTLFCAKKLPIENEFKVYLVAERKSHGITTTAVYEVDNNCCRIYAKNRALADILRSVAHEMTHMMQEEKDMLEFPVQDAGGHIEDEANAKAGELIKLFAKSKPTRGKIYESTLRSNKVI